MAKKKTKRRNPPRLQEPGAPAPNVRRVRRPSPSESIRPRKTPNADPVKSMLIGMLIIGLLAAFFLMPIAGKPVFNHIVDPGPDAGAAPDAGK